MLASNSGSRSALRLNGAGLRVESPSETRSVGNIFRHRRPQNRREATNRLSKLPKRAEHGKKVIISRHGKPVVLLLAIFEKRRGQGTEAHLEPFPVGWEAPMSWKKAAA